MVVFCVFRYDRTTVVSDWTGYTPTPTLYNSIHRLRSTRLNTPSRGEILFGDNIDGLLPKFAEVASDQPQIESKKSSSSGSPSFSGFVGVISFASTSVSIVEFCKESVMSFEAMDSFVRDASTLRTFP